MSTSKLYHHHYFARGARFSVADIKHAISQVEGFNAKLAVVITQAVGSMACAYIFCLLALVSLPAVLVEANFVPTSTFPHFLIQASLIAFVAWIAQTFLQLVLLPIIIVGQNVQAAASDARAQKTYEDTEAIKEDLLKALDALSLETEGGLKNVLDAIDALKQAK